MKSKKGIKLMFAGGGTGGHLYPALAIAELMSARHPGFEALFIGTRSGIEANEEGAQAALGMDRGCCPSGRG